MSRIDSRWHSSRRLMAEPSAPAGYNTSASGLIELKFPGDPQHDPALRGTRHLLQRYVTHMKQSHPFHCSHRLQREEQKLLLSGVEEGTRVAAEELHGGRGGAAPLGQRTLRHGCAVLRESPFSFPLTLFQESGGICLVDLPFSLTLAACSTCPTLHDALGKLSQHQEVDTSNC